jgi:sulfatase modifying factor 1
MRRIVLVIGACVLGALGCNAILGISDHPVAPEVDGGARDATTGKDAGSGSGSSSGSGTSSDSGSSSGSGSSSSSSGSSSGPGTGSCGPSGPGTTECGGTEDSCCTSLDVDGGTFYRTYSNTGAGATGEADPATVSGFKLDKYLVTVGRFRQFVAAWMGGYFPPNKSGKHTYLNGGAGLVNSAMSPLNETGWQTSADWDASIAPTNENMATCAPDVGPTPTWTPEAGPREKFPINCINWYEAYAFCIWDGGFLPSEPEWEYAAAGGSEQREYPWGITPPGNQSQYAIYGEYYHSDAGILLAPVGSAPHGAAQWGQLDIVGDVWEWGLDWAAGPGGYVNPCTNCAYLPTTPPAVTKPPFPDGGMSVPARVFRGGSAFDVVATLAPEWAGFNVPTNRKSGVGVRCARAP